MALSDILASVLGVRRNPAEAILAQSLGGGSSPGGGAAAQPQQPPQPQPQQPPPGPQATPTPITNPAPPGSQGSSYQSPPDLANMYLKLVQDNENARRMDEGMTTIAAGFAQPDNRQALLSSIGRGAPRDPAVTMNGLIELQKLQASQQQAGIAAAQLPALAKQYGLDDATIKYLAATGKLDEVVKSFADPATEVVEKADGSKILVNKKTGNVIHELSPSKPRATEYVEKGDGSKVLVYSDDKTEVSSGKQLTDVGAKLETEVVKGANDENILINKKTGEKIGTVTEGDPNKGDYTVTAADGSVRRYSKDNQLITELAPAKELNAEDKAKLDQINQERKDAGQPPMSAQEYYKGDPLAADHAKLAQINADRKAARQAPMSAEEYYKGVLNADDKDKLDRINQERAAAGKPAMSVEDFYKNVSRSGTTINLGPNGTKYPDPPAGQDYVRNDDGTVKVTDGKPTLYDIPGSDKEAKAAKAEADTTEAVANDAAKNAVQDSDINAAVTLIDRQGNKAAGWGSVLSAVPNTTANTLSGMLNTISGNVAVDQLQAMRKASPTGGALGNVSNYEDRMMRGLLGNLAQSQNPTVLKYNLQRLGIAKSMVVNGVKDPTTGKYRAATEAEIQKAVDTVQRPEAAGGPLEGKTINGHVITPHK